ncbi:Rho termination factor N-terminal domain-containing protein [Nocardia sp. NPDC058666]|uniref:Rho termination factor N-terminal domain-containing protein n=1 Tax=Nocardia sp. NPDC058666 TaxID=3346587 RepID=UPI003662A4D5
MVLLQAKYYEFLERQDEATLRAIIDGTAELTVVPVGSATGSHRTAVTGPRISPSAPVSEIDQVVQEFRRLTPGVQRGVLLNRAKLSVKALQQVAKLLGMKGYSKLKKDELVDLLVRFSVDDGTGGVGPTVNTDFATDSSAAPATTVKADEPKVPVQSHASRGLLHVPEPAPTASAAATTAADAAAIAAHLRVTETEDAGAAYLREQNLDRARLLAVAAELQLTRVDRLSRAELEKRVLKQAISARRKFAGLRRW